jgi:hypothetical protein
MENTQDFGRFIEVFDKIQTFCVKVNCHRFLKCVLNFPVQEMQAVCAPARVKFLEESSLPWESSSFPLRFVQKCNSYINVPSS